MFDSFQPQPAARRRVFIYWNSAVLNFHETERVVRTASIWQVRQKLYTNAIGRSAAYQKWLGPLLKIDSSRYERLLERIAK